MAANLTNVLLDYADVSYAKLRGINLEGASLRHTRGLYACFIASHMEAATTDYVNFEGAVLNGVESRQTSYECGNLRGASLIDINLDGTILRGTQLQEARLQGMHIAHGGLDRADVAGAEFREAHLEATNLRFANGITEAQIQSAHTDTNTQRPLKAELWSSPCSAEAR